MLGCRRRFGNDHMGHQHGFTGYPVIEHKKNNPMLLDSYQLDLPFRHYQHVCDFVIFMQFLQCDHFASFYLGRIEIFDRPGVAGAVL